MPLVYVIDTSSLINLKDRYPESVFPSLWERISDLCKNERLIAPYEVLEEIEAGDDELKVWARQNRIIFVEPDEEQTKIAKQILQDFPDLAKPGKDGPNADPWVVALAVWKRSEEENKFESFRNAYIVVTEESKRRQDNIPAACRYYGIESLNILELFQREEWRF